MNTYSILWRTISRHVSDCRKRCLIDAIIAHPFAGDDKGALT
jgi:hypothetical protein